MMIASVLGFEPGQGPLDPDAGSLQTEPLSTLVAQMIASLRWDLVVPGSNPRTVLQNYFVRILFSSSSMIVYICLNLNY